MYGDKKYQHRVESKIMMSLGEYRVVQQVDLESVIEERKQELSPTDYNIYFIVQRPRSFVNAKTVKIDGNLVTFDAMLEIQDTYKPISVKLRLNKASSEISIFLQYPYNHFALRDEEKLLLMTKVSTMLDEQAPEDDDLDYEVLYIGKSYGNDGNRTAIDRVLSHKTLQEIYADAMIYHPDKEISVILCQFNQAHLVGHSREKNVESLNPKEDQERHDRFSDMKYFEKWDRQRLSLTEAALIHYFQPPYNKEFKKSFPDRRHKTYSDCFDMDFRSVSIEIDTSELKRKLYSKSVERKMYHVESYPFIGANGRYDFIELRD